MKNHNVIQMPNMRKHSHNVDHTENEFYGKVLTDAFSPVPRILIVGEESFFCKAMSSFASQRGFRVTVCNTFEDLADLNDYNFDVAIFNSNLGIDFSFYILSHFEKLTGKNVPVIFVKQDGEPKQQHWPEAIREVIYQHEGPNAILDAAYLASRGVC